MIKRELSLDVYNNRGTLFSVTALFKLTCVSIDDRRYTKDKIYQSKESHHEDEVAHIDPEDVRNTIAQEVRPNSNIDDWRGEN